MLGGTSPFGWRGGVFGSIGAVLVQTASNGLVMLNSNPYLYPLVNSLIIFIAAWVDGRRRLMTERLEQRKIRDRSPILFHPGKRHDRLPVHC